jgi:hypothetical protein
LLGPPSSHLVAANRKHNYLLVLGELLMARSQPDFPSFLLRLSHHMRYDGHPALCRASLPKLGVLSPRAGWPGGGMDRRPCPPHPLLPAPSPRTVPDGSYVARCNRSAGMRATEMFLLNTYLVVSGLRGWSSSTRLCMHCCGYCGQQVSFATRPRRAQPFSMAHARLACTLRCDAM